MRYRLRTLLILMAVGPIPLAALSANFLTLPLRESDKIDATRHLVAWIVENRPMPGFGESYPDLKWKRYTEHFLVTCDYLSPDARVSDDSCVQRVTRKEFDDILQSTGLDNGIRIQPTINSKQVLGLDAECFGGLHHSRGFEFEFRRKVWGLQSLRKSWSVPVQL